MGETRELILKRFEYGEITLEEADQLLSDLENQSWAEEDPAEDVETPGLLKTAESIPEEFKKFKRTWIWFALVGGLFVLWGSLGMFNGFERNQLGFGFWISWIPMLLGLGIIVAAVNSRKSIWIHVRVFTGKNEWPRRIIISLPFPEVLTRFAAQMALKMKIDGVGRGQFDVSDVDAMITAIKESDVPLAIHVDEGKDNEKVQVYIGR